MLNNQDLLKQKAYVDGTWTDSIEGTRFEVNNPYDGSLITTVPDMGTEDAEQAIAAADRAFKEWKQTTAGERAILLRRWSELLLDNLEDLALLLTLEQGKPLSEAQGEIRYGAAFLEWFSEEARRTYGDVIPGHARNKRIVTLKQPIGVVAAITPWNFPNAMIARKVGPALAAGCTMVVKPAEDTPLSALAMAALAEEAGIPAGVLNVITTNQPVAVGKALTESPVVRKLSFTGSTQTGKLLMSQCASTLKKVSLELGGNAPFIVFDDADIDAAVAGAIASKYRNAGQTCVCANRLYVQREVFDVFTEKLSAAVKSLNLGQGTDPEVHIGPLINDAALEKVERLIVDATHRGARVLTGGNRHDNDGINFYEPTVLIDVDTSMAISHEEIFGPVAPVFVFDTEAEVIALANNTNYGLASYFYGSDNARIWRVAEALEYGMVGINTGMISTPVAPFGGVKESGIGREGSKYGIEEYLEIKYLCFAV